LQQNLKSIKLSDKYVKTIYILFKHVTNNLPKIIAILETDQEYSNTYWNHMLSTKMHHIEDILMHMYITIIVTPKYISALGNNPVVCCVTSKKLDNNIIKYIHKINKLQFGRSYYY